jgi:hypothetical protein
MIVYHKGENASKQKSFTMSICPAKHLEGQGEMPSDWVDDKNVPLEFNVEFVFGKATVPDSIGNYLIKNQMAKRSRLIMPSLLAA